MSQHAHEIAKLAARVEFLRAAYYVARTVRDDNRCWVPPEGTVSPLITEAPDRDLCAVVEQLDRVPVKGDVLMSAREIDEEIARLNQRLRSLSA